MKNRKQTAVALALLLSACTTADPSPGIRGAKFDYCAKNKDYVLLSPIRENSTVLLYPRPTETCDSECNRLLSSENIVRVFQYKYESDSFDTWIRSDTKNLLIDSKKEASADYIAKFSEPITINKNIFSHFYEIRFQIFDAQTLKLAGYVPYFFHHHITSGLNECPHYSIYLDEVRNLARHKG